MNVRVLLTAGALSLGLATGALAQAAQPGSTVGMDAQMGQGQMGQGQMGDDMAQQQRPMKRKKMKKSMKGKKMMRSNNRMDPGMEQGAAPGGM